jgi:hypothetical protein
MKKILLGIALAFTTLTCLGQSGALHRVFTFGNVAEIKTDSEFLAQLQRLLDIDDAYTVLISGDLIDEDASNGISDSEKERLNRILSICQHSEKSKVVIIPGDRDWDDSGKDGLKSVKALRNIVNDMGLERVEWAISKGCPGPKTFELTKELVLIGIDTQWWNHPYDRPRPADGDCKTITETDILSELSEAIEDAEGKNVLIAGHFPLYSVGHYGGKSVLSEHLTPPIYGSMRAAFHQNIGGVKDIRNERFDPIRKELLKMVREKGSIIYVSGHEQNMQVVIENESFLINSGSPTSPHHVGRAAGKVQLAEAIPGIIEIYYHPNGQVDCLLYESIRGGNLELKRNEPLMSSPCAEHGQRYHVNTHFVPCLDRTAYETGITSALQMTSKGGDYRIGGITKVLLGTHYRSTWTQVVDAPFLNLKTDKSGLKVYEKGGGRQTTSLKMKGGDGREYVFRSVDKQPTRVLDANLKETIISEVLQDATSMQHPYGAMAICTMLDQTEILHASPKLFIIPDDPSLGPFRKDYAGLFGMLEEKPINPKKVAQPFGEADEILQSFKMIREQYNDHNHRIDYKEYAQARIFDILVGDWGRHQDNWKWAGYEQEEGMVYRPIPRDRDHVFSRWDGLLPYLADRKWGKASGENFDYKLHDIRSLTWQTRHSDRFWLNEASRQDWIDAAAYIQGRITDEVIDDAVRNMPPETLELSGLEIANKLKQRRIDLLEYAEEYYELLAQEVDVVGSNERERFTALRQVDGSVEVSMFDIPKSTMDAPKKIYHRVFYPKETKEIRLYGLGDDDVFEISGESQKSIRIRVMGGPGVDDVSDLSAVNSGGKRTFVYENNDKSQIDLGSDGKQIFNQDPNLYDYDRTRFAYNRYGPMLSLGFNSTEGFGVMSGLRFTNQKFGKKDFSSKHSIKGKVTTEGIALLSYNGRYRHVIGKWDLTVKGGIADVSEFLRFYGNGNGAEILNESGDLSFFETGLKNAHASVGLLRDFWKRSSLSLALHYENNTNAQISTELENSLAEGVTGLGDANLAEGIIGLDLDFRNRSTVASKGMRFWIQQQFGVNTVETDKDYFILRASLENHATFKVFSPWTLSLKANASTSSGEDAIPFYHRVFLGQNSGLRGYQNNRFTGQSTASFNSELRIPLSRIKNSIVPLIIGVKGFYDVGRVYSDADVNDDLAMGYGAGIFLIPFSESIAINISYGMSDEESGLVLLSIGTNFR